MPTPSREEKIAPNHMNTEEINKRFDEKFTYASFTWNGDNETGVKCAKATKRKVKSFIQSEIDKAVQETKEKMEKERISEMDGIFSLKD